MYAHQEALIKTNVIRDIFKDYIEARTNSRIFFQISQDIRLTKINVIKVIRKVLENDEWFLRVKKAFVTIYLNIKFHLVT